MDYRTGTPVVGLGQGQTSFNHVSLVNTSTPFFEEEENHERTEKPVVCPQRGARPQQFIIGNDETESELSVGSRSLLSRVNDQVRKRQKRSSMNVTENDEKTFCDMGNVHDCNNGISSIHGKELPEQLSIHCEYNRSHT